MNFIKLGSNYDCIIYTNLFGVVSDTPCIMLQRKQWTHILYERFVRGNRIPHVVSCSKYLHVNSICFIRRYYSNMESI